MTELDHTRALDLLRRWEPGEDVDDDALVSGLLSHFLDRGGVPDELQVRPEPNPHCPDALRGLLGFKWYGPSTLERRVVAVFEIITTIETGNQTGVQIVYRGLCDPGSFDLRTFPRGWLAVDLAFPTPEDPF